MRWEDAGAQFQWPKFRFQQILHAREQELTTSWDAISTLSLRDREFLNAHCAFDSLKIVRRESHENASAVKFLFELHDGKKIETVVLFHTTDTKKWATVCVSSQVGCAMGCSFCATGKLGFARNLSSEEIVDQFIFAKREAVARGIAAELNVVFMGMGEPLLNFDAVTSAISILTSPSRFGLSPRRITVSTCGIVPEMHRLFSVFPKINLALSLHAPTDDLRNSLMRINKTHSLISVLEAIKEWEDSGNRVLIENLLIEGKNDTMEHAQQLAQLMRGRFIKVNLIPWNAVAGFGWKRPSVTRVRKFFEVLTREHILTTIRHEKGDEIQAACGQLAGETIK